MQLFEVVYYEERKTVRVYVPVPVFFSKKGLLGTGSTGTGNETSRIFGILSQIPIRSAGHPGKSVSGASLISRLHSANESSPSGTVPVHNLNCQLVFRIRIVLFTILDPYSFF